MTMHINNPELEKQLEEFAKEIGENPDSIINEVLKNYLGKQHLDKLLLEGLNSGVGKTPDKNYWNDKKNNLKSSLNR